MKHLLFIALLFLLSVAFTARDVSDSARKSDNHIGEFPKLIMPICRFTKWIYTGKTKMENEYADTAQAVQEGKVRQEPF